MNNQNNSSFLTVVAELNNGWTMVCPWVHDASYVSNDHWY